MAVATLAGAGCSSSSNPIAPGGGPEPRQTYTLSGVVTEMTPHGAAPIAGAVVLESPSQLQATPTATAAIASPDCSRAPGCSG